MDARELRLAQNETIFREINERVRDVELTTADYERVRADGARFFIFPGHELPEIEHILERHDGWSLIEKKGDAAEYTRDVDPREPQGT